MPAGEVVAAVQDWIGGPHQRVTGALRSLAFVGLVERCETPEGAFWKATDAAVRAEQLYDPEIGGVTDGRP